MKIVLFGCLLSALASASYAQDYPKVEIASESLAAVIYLPDARNGYYRATRFDWSGIIQSLKYKGHEYFGPRLEQPDPLVHNSVCGPVDSFDANLGFDEAKPGGGFVRVGVGILQKPADPNYRPAFDRTYTILNPGEWRITRAKDWIEFVHEIPEEGGYRYVYTKRIQLTQGRAEMVISHALKNTGSKTIETTQFNHNFFMIDRQPSGTGLTFRFPFTPKIASVQGDPEIQVVRGNDLVVNKAPEGKASSLVTVTGYGSTPQDNDISLENQNTGVGVKIRGDRPMVSLRVYVIQPTVAPEPFVRLSISPGETEIWETRYTFYTLK